MLGAGRDLALEGLICFFFVGQPHFEMARRRALLINNIPHRLDRQ